MIFPISLIAFEKMRKKIMFWIKNTVSFYCVINSLRTNMHNDSFRVKLGLSGAMIFPISLIAFEKMRKKVMLWKKDTVSFYCVNICLRTNIHNDSCRVQLGLSDTLMIFPISLIAFEKQRKKVVFWEKDMVSFYCSRTSNCLYKTLPLYKFV